MSCFLLNVATPATPKVSGELEKACMSFGSTNCIQNSLASRSVLVIVTVSRISFFFCCAHPPCQRIGSQKLQTTHLGTPDAIGGPAARISRDCARLASSLPDGTSARTISGPDRPAPCLHRNAFLVESDEQLLLRKHRKIKK